jgi:polysaccharide export outer membrane protein
MRNIFMSWIAALMLAFASCGPGFADSGRLLTTNDVLQITVLNQPDLGAAARVEPDGTIALTYTGRLRVAGMTTGALATKIANILVQKGLVKNPEVSIELTTFGMQVSVLGAVGAPGNYILDRPTTLPQILARAGGIREDAGAATVVIHSGNGGVRRIDAKELLAGRASFGPPLSNNDTIYVEQGSIFYLYGYVNRPGEYPISRPGLTVRQAIAVGGGVAPLGSDWWRLLIRRRINGAIVEITPELDDLVEQNDTIIVNERVF